MSIPPPSTISPDSPLQDREITAAGPMARTYVCKSCGTATVVGDSSFTHVVNPFRLTTASICVGCGATPLSVLNWEDTGETVEAFRKRMWKKTPLYVKLIHFLVIPGLIAFLPTLAVDPDVVEGNALWIARGLVFGAVYLVVLLIFWFTPLAGIAPAICGVKYYKYK